MGLEERLDHLHLPHGHCQVPTTKTRQGKGPPEMKPGG